MRVVLTGGAGFIGRVIVRLLVQRGDDVVALVREPADCDHIAGPGVELAGSDLSDVAALIEQMGGAEGVIHAAGDYRIGIAESEHDAMWDANVGTTTRVLDAAIAAGVPRIVYVSTVNVLGDTHGAIPHEGYRRDLVAGFLSWYDETKFRAHEIAEDRIGRGAPIVIVMPSQVYGLNDHALASNELRLAHAGRLAYVSIASTGLSWAHVEDVAAGIVAALGRGRIGSSYFLAGDCRRVGESVAIAAKVGGHRAPRLSIPGPVIKFLAALNDRAVHTPRMPANLREIARGGVNVTYWAAHDLASQELGFQPRSLEQGIADTWGRGWAGTTAPLE